MVYIYVLFYIKILQSHLLLYITVKNAILFSLFVLATFNVISSAVFQTKTMTNTTLRRVNF